MNFLTKTAILLSIILLFAVYWYNHAHHDVYAVSPEGVLHYPLEREVPQISSTLAEQNDHWAKYHLTFPSKKIILHAFLYQPKKEGTSPAVVLLAGGGKAKEDVKYEEELLANHSIVVLALDQRGVGETAGSFPSMDQDFKTFKQGEEPNLHLVIYDILASFDVLKSLPYVDNNKISVAGESQGGRFAIIAGAVEPRFKKVIAIAAAGFGSQQMPSPQSQQFFNSINPDFYVDKISPREFIMIHSQGDTMISTEAAKTTFHNAKEPKEFYEVKTCQHGYCPELDEIVVKVLSYNS